MHSSSRAARAAFIVAGAMTVFGATTVAAQRSHPAGRTPPAPRDPRVATAASPRQAIPRRGDPFFGNGFVTTRRNFDRGGRDGFGHHLQRIPNNVGSNVTILPSEYGYGYYGAGYGAVYDVNGRPLYMSNESDAPVGFSYTPDLSGSPYRIADNGMMLVDFDNGEHRGFPSCASQQSLHDPQGRPRTVFYHPPEYELVLSPGNRGRVEGMPPAGAAACYGLDANGHTVLRY